MLSPFFFREWASCFQWPPRRKEEMDEGGTHSHVCMYLSRPEVMRRRATFRTRSPNHPIWELCSCYANISPLPHSAIRSQTPNCCSRSWCAWMCSMWSTPRVHSRSLLLQQVHHSVLVTAIKLGKGQSICKMEWKKVVFLLGRHTWTNMHALI